MRLGRCFPVGEPDGRNGEFSLRDGREPLDGGAKLFSGGGGLEQQEARRTDALRNNGFVRFS
jgi:hypothetical protein